MFESKELVFYYAISPVHMGAGSSTGAVDLPIQREIHTGHPILAGSGIKGALRHDWSARGFDKSDGEAIFGPDSNASDHAGAVAFTDAQLVAFPVRSLRETFVYATSPSALARLKRMAGDKASWSVPTIEQGHFLIPSASLDRLTSGATTADRRLVLESFEFTYVAADETASIAKWLAEHVMPSSAEYAFFRGKLSKDLVVLNDGDFSHFAKNSTIVEPHVRIDDNTGTAKDGGLFYAENLPPESILAGQILASVERRKGSSTRASDVMLRLVNNAIDNRLVQIGGDATTGRGQVLIHLAQEGALA